jgi:hypothetical protein
MGRLTAVAFISALLLSVAGFSQTATQAPAVTRGDVEALTTSVGELIELFRSSIEQQTEHRKLELSISYLQFRSRRIEALEQELRNTAERQASTLEVIERQKSQLADMEITLRDESSPNNERARRGVEYLKSNIELQEGKLERLELKAIDLENDIGDGKRQLFEFEDYVLERLRLDE